MKGPTCPFCARIADGEVEQTGDPDVVTFEPLRPVTPGHRLFLPVQHVPRFDRVPALLGRVAAQAAARVFVDGPQAANLIVSAGSVATQTIPHFHVHLVPRRPLDGLHLPWTGQP